ncbi:hypothetical protein HUT16_08360 [Kitasatospora sp. NA04385]|uniref:hypothetical protein n=1 Tax=Kitasatospora sp. NA04385 TaxID=2742135 RepID=UPI0015928786|nr:hypothetical protein [Kitasatospora sp. NA04385]QKW19073.1 hypothetical protein HUT16_08360 [Kitasatospora sp. NA04385]
MVQISTRAADLWAAIERATGARADVRLTVSSTRISVPAPPEDAPSWGELLKALRTADRWGSVTADGRTDVWAQIDEDG